MKTRQHRSRDADPSSAQAHRRGSAAHGADPLGALSGSPRMLAQRKAIDAAFGEQESPASEAAPNQTGMPDSLKAGIESLSGMNMSDVRVHANSSQPAQLNALAYAQGNDIHLAPGQEKHLPHEAWHVVQQRQGRVAPTTQLQGIAVNDDASLEEEADTMGAKAAQAKLEEEP